MGDLIVRRYHDRSGGYKLAENPVPLNILEKIVWQKELELLNDLSLPQSDPPPVRNLIESLRSSGFQPGLIAEVKKASPSKGVLRSDFDPVAIAKEYELGGAMGISVLTDRVFFQGGFENLALVRSAVNLPLLCKEFVIDSRQVAWARAFGADAVLLIVAILSDRDLGDLFQSILSLGMQALIEVHTVGELQRVLALPEVLEGLQKNKGLIGVNNRDLRDFKVSLQTTMDVISTVPQDLRESLFWVSESGLFNRSDLDIVERAGAKAVLVGESLITQPQIAQSVKKLISHSS